MKNLLVRYWVKCVACVVVLSIGFHFCPAQVSVRLNNNWEFLKQDLGGVWEAVRPLTKTGPENVPVWQKISLPHCYNAEDAVDSIPNYYQGPAWYRTQLKIANPYKNGRTILHFEGSGQKTEIYVYTTKVGSHIGGYDEFSVDITDAVAAFEKTDPYQKQFNGKIPIEVRVDNSRDLEMIPSNLSDFMVYGGIYRYLNLVYVPAVSIDKLFVSAVINDKTNKGNISVKARFYNPYSRGDANVLTKVFDSKGKLVQQKQQNFSSINGDEKLAEFNIDKVQRWSPHQPVLYTVELTISSGGDTVIQKQKIGLRSFEFLSKGPFLLNGKRLLLQGTHRHEDAAGVGAAVTEEMMRKEMILIKEMGANFIRLGHYQQSNIVLNLCDSLGLLVWEEIPWCRGGIGGDAYKQQARQMLTNMIEQHYNHPSIIIWGLGNENDWAGDQTGFDKEKICSFMKELNTLSHNLDASRKTAIRRCDFCSEMVDVYSPSIWMGWYKGIFTDYDSESHKEFQKQDHFIHIEWGGDSQAGRHSEKIETLLQHALNAKQNQSIDTSFVQFAREVKDNDWSETYICHLFDWHLKEQENMPWLTGSAFWTFKDFATPLRPENPVPYVNQKGVLERDGAIKESYYVFQSYWSKKPMVHIYGHSWPVRWGDVGEEKLVEVYSNCEQAELFVNGKSYGIKKRNSQDFPAAGLRWDVVFNEGKNSVKVIAQKNKLQVWDSIVVNYQTKKWTQPAKFLLRKVADDGGVATIQAMVMDSNGIPCLDAMNKIKFKIAGDGSLIENQGTSTGSSSVQLSNGCATIKLNTNKGKSVVSVSSEGLPAAFIEIE